MGARLLTRQAAPVRAVERGSGFDDALDEGDPVTQWMIPFQPHHPSRRKAGEPVAGVQMAVPVARRQRGRAAAGAAEDVDVARFHAAVAAVNRSRGRNTLAEDIGDAIRDLADTDNSGTSTGDEDAFTGSPDGNLDIDPPIRGTVPRRTAKRTPPKT